MATLNAFKQLGASIAADVADAKNAVARKVAHVQAERKIMKMLKATLREHPVELTKAIANMAQQQ